MTIRFYLFFFFFNVGRVQKIYRFIGKVGRESAVYLITMMYVCGANQEMVSFKSMKTKTNGPLEKSEISRGDLCFENITPSSNGLEL